MHLLRLFVAITDTDWFEYLSQAINLDEVNFWQPSGNVRFRALQPGEPFLFKLHSPQDFIVGGGFFNHFTILPASFAWKAFGIKNGARTEEEMRARIAKYRRTEPQAGEDYNIGCILLQSPFFFERRDWIRVEGWHRSIVRGRGYESDAELGKSLWQQIESRLLSRPAISSSVSEESPRFGQPMTVLPRLGQGSFRVLVTDAYERRCALTRSPILHVLDAAHIRPYAQQGPHSVTNGILLRQDFHTLFDRGYLTVTPEYRLEVSRRIREEFDNGKEYYQLHGSAVCLPGEKSLWPGGEYLEWHNENLYLG